MNKIDKLTEATLKTLQGIKLESRNYNNPVSFVVQKLIREKLIYDKDVYKANDLLQSYYDFNHILERDDLSNEILRLCETGRDYCYYDLCKLLKVDKLD